MQGSDVHPCSQTSAGSGAWKARDLQYGGCRERQRIPLIARWNADYRPGDGEQY